MKFWFEERNVPIRLLLDIVKVARSNSGFNLATAFTAVLEDYEIKNRVSTRSILR